MAHDSGQQRQVMFLPEGARRTRGRDAQSINILVAKAVAEAIKTTLGPRGMDKMVVDDLGDVTISNDGATILEEMDVEHPVAKMLVEIAKTQDEEVGDGTTTAVVVAGSLLDGAEKLLNDGIHPSIIVKGYRLASKKARNIAAEAADKITFNDKAMLKNIAMTSMTGKSGAEAEESLANIVVNAVLQVSEETKQGRVVDKENIKIEKKEGATLSDSQLISGVVIDKEIVHSDMPKRTENGKIALIDSALEIKETETNAEISISDPDQLQAFVEKEESMLKAMVEQIKRSGATVVFCQKGIDDVAQHFMAKEGIVAVRRVKKSDMESIAKATGAKIINRVKDLSKEDLGYAKTVREEKIGGSEMLFVEGCKNPKAVSILIRGGTDHIVAEAERAAVDAIGTVSSALKSGEVVAGGGSIEMEIAMKLRDYAPTVGGREQLAIESFADSMETVPKALAETAGMDSIDALVELRSKHKSKGGKYMGVNVYKGKIADMKAMKVLEPLAVKTQAIASGAEVAEMILRIDDIIAGSSKNKGGGMPPGGMGGPGMGYE